MSGLGLITRSTERMVLRPLTESDGSEYARVLDVSKDAWNPWTPARDPATRARDVFRRELRRTRDGAKAGTHLRLAGFRGDGALVGMFSLNEIVLGVFQSAYAGWQVSADQARQGLGTEGVGGLLDIAFDDPPSGVGLHRVQANIMPANAPSLRIAEKVGFRHEGHALRYLQIAGRWEDHEVYALTREERGA